jgi:F0F1-type ATP synthase assembly protein I
MKNYSEMSNEELHKNMKTSKTMISILLVGIVLVILISFYRGKLGWNLINIPLPLSVFLFFYMDKIQKIKKKLKSREN